MTTTNAFVIKKYTGEKVDSWFSLFDLSPSMYYPLNAPRLNTPSRIATSLHSIHSTGCLSLLSIIDIAAELLRQSQCFPVLIWGVLKHLLLKHSCTASYTCVTASLKLRILGLTYVLLFLHCPLMLYTCFM